MISNGEKKYLEHAIELAEYIDQQNMTGNLKSEILDKMLIPYGLSDEKKNEAKPASTEQPKNQPPQPQVKPQVQPKTDSVMDIVNAHKDKMRIDGERVVLTGKIDDYWAVVDEFKQRKWKHIPSEKLSNGKWKDGYFDPVEVKA